MSAIGSIGGTQCEIDITISRPESIQLREWHGKATIRHISLKQTIEFDNLFFAQKPVDVSVNGKHFGEAYIQSVTATDYMQQRIVEIRFEGNGEPSI